MIQKVSARPKDIKIESAHQPERDDEDDDAVE